MAPCQVTKYQVSFVFSILSIHVCVMGDVSFLIKPYSHCRIITANHLHRAVGRVVKWRRQLLVHRPIYSLLIHLFTNIVYENFRRHHACTYIYTYLHVLIQENCRGGILCLNGSYDTATCAFNGDPVLDSVDLAISECQDIKFLVLIVSR